MDGSDDALIAQAQAWAAKRKRPLDAGLLADVLELRSAYDDRSPGSWPEGSAHDLVLVRWPAHRPGRVPEPETLVGTLETFWRFLRGTGRMAMVSAEPGALVKELRRALPKMADACADRSNWSQGRVLGEFGASIGIDLSMSESVEEAQAKLAEIMARWNELPVEERVRLMPDPSPKSAKGLAMTDALAAMRDGAYDDGYADVVDGEVADIFGPRRGDPGVAARQARESAFVRRCLDLVAWVGHRKEVTSIGVLRPTVARDAYLDLDLYAWQEAHKRYHELHEPEPAPQSRDSLAERWANSFDSARDCEPLHRLWRAAEVAQLIEVRATVASGRVPTPATDTDWLQLALLLLVGLAGTLDPDRVDALLVMLDLLTGRPDGEAALAQVEQRWLGVRSQGEDVERIADPDMRATFRRVYLLPIEDVLRAFDDTGVWTRRDGWVAVTDLGREFAGILTVCIERGLFDAIFAQEE